MKNCGKCGKSASLVCGGCGDVVYCTTSCQKSAWKNGHKRECKAYKIEIHPEYGRYLVATRELKPGSRILCKLQPAVVGPPLINPNYGCLNCHNPVKKSVICPTCKNIFCSQKCLQIFCSQTEMCEFLAKLDKPNLRIISPLKFLCLEKSDKNTFDSLMKLESHSEELQKSDRWTDLKKNVIDPLVDITNENPEKITELVGILSTNSFELLNQMKAEQGKAPFSGLFELASLMNHHCIGNTRLVVDNDSNGIFKLSVYASVAISKGSPILFNYVKPLDRNMNRQENLMDFKFFKCSCSRCEDPTEMNTFNSAYLCPKCQVGPVIFKQKNWMCNDCQADFDPVKVKHIEDQISKAQEKLVKIQRLYDLAQAKTLFKDFQSILYPSHGFMLEILQALITCTASAINNPGPEKELLMQRERIKWCSQIMESLDVLEPGLSIGRGEFASSTT